MVMVNSYQGDRLPFGPALSAPAGGEFQDKTVNIHS